MFPKINLMVDIETLGTRPTAPVLSIGACWFNIYTSEIGETFERFIDLNDACRFTKIETEALKFWLTKDKPLIETNFFGKDRMGDALGDLREFYNSGNDACIWANSPSFDLVILENAYNKYLGSNVPWSFWKQRCTRTVCQLAQGKVSKPPAYANKGSHTPLGDCIHQARYVSKMFQALRPDLVPVNKSIIDDF